MIDKIDMENKDKTDPLIVFSILYKKKIQILFFSFVVSFFAIIYSFFMKDIYLSEALIMPSNSSGSSSLDRYASLASLGGIQLPGSPSQSRLEEAVATLTSKEFIINFVNVYDLDKLLFASKSWDKKKDRIIFDESIYDMSSSNWVSNFSGINGRPSDLELYEAFKTNFQIYEDLETKFYTLSFRSLSPKISKEVLENVIFKVNENLKNKDIESAKNSITYLQSQLSKTTSKDLKNIFYEMIADQTKKIMIAQGEEDYIFKVIDPPYLPENRSSPKRRLILFTAFLISFAVSLIFFLTLNLLNKELIVRKNFPYLKIIDEEK
ncbi:MAG: hypothetical protein CBE41_04130 [Gammaproteobacteria bacterium TMED281]|nr:MAG: hypothetical protein CBE41_04130 [Gammaproteobacteria bacterium TMED281]|tara:strand:- start:27 stop:992 length:966 start_codon:yes stop_codon:yes gene_type:complete